MESYNRFCNIIILYSCTHIDILIGHIKLVKTRDTAVVGGMLKSPSLSFASKFAHLQMGKKLTCKYQRLLKGFSLLDFNHGPVQQ